MRHRTPYICAPIVCALALLIACQGDPKVDRDEKTVEAPVLDRLHWESTPEADRYELRVWAAHRLLFETTTADTQLVLTPVQRRAIAAFDSVRAVVRALRLGERIAGSERSYRIRG